MLFSALRRPILIQLINWSTNTSVDMTTGKAFMTKVMSAIFTHTTKFVLNTNVYDGRICKDHTYNTNTHFISSVDDWHWKRLLRKQMSTKSNLLFKHLNVIFMDFYWAVSGWIKYHSQVSDISRTLVGNKIVDHSDVAGASPVGAAPTTSSFST